MQKVNANFRAARKLVNEIHGKTEARTCFCDYNIASDKIKIVCNTRNAANAVLEKANTLPNFQTAYVDNFWGAIVIRFNVAPEVQVKRREARNAREAASAKEKEARLAARNA